MLSGVSESSEAEEEARVVWISMESGVDMSGLRMLELVFMSGRRLSRDVSRLFGSETGVRIFCSWMNRRKNELFLAAAGVVEHAPC